MTGRWIGRFERTVRSADRGLLLLLAASLLVQTALLAKVGDMRCTGDACMYIHCARSLSSGSGWEYGGPRAWDAGHTPPLYVLFLVLHLKLFEAGIFTSKASQIGMVLASAALSYRVARNAWGRKAGLWAAAAVAFHPELIAFAHYNFSEVLYSFLLLLGFSLLVWARRDPGRADRKLLALAGIALGLATLTREATWLLAPVLAAVAAFDRPLAAGHFLKRFAAVELPVMLLVAPWAAYNTQRFGTFLLLSTNAGNVFYHNQNSNSPENYDFRGHLVGPEPYAEPPRPRCGLANVVANYRCEMSNALRYMLAHPYRVAARALPKLAALVNPASFPVRFLREGEYGEASAATVKLVTAATAGSFMAVTLLAVLALWMGPPGPERRLTAIVLLFFLGIFAVTFGMSRYRLPLTPLLAIQASAVLARPAILTAQLRSPRRWAGLLATLLFLGWAWSRYLPLILDVFQSGGS
jgi:4-amino-4-deoxy-L-arabinose transferase-like glycosyltransferase